MYLTEKISQQHPRSSDDHEEVELLLESFSKQTEEIVSEVETLSVSESSLRPDALILTPRIWISRLT